MKTKRMTRIALLTALALGIFLLEMQIPMPIRISGVKLGLANIVTLFALFTLGVPDACWILFLRILLGSLFGGLNTLPYSLAGGGMSLLSLLALRHMVTQKQIWVCGVLSGLFHNLGQLLMAVLLTGTPSLLLYLPPLAACGILTGLLTGLCAQLCILRLRRRKI